MSADVVRATVVVVLGGAVTRGAAVTRVAVVDRGADVALGASVVLWDEDARVEFAGGSLVSLEPTERVTTPMIETMRTAPAAAPRSSLRLLRPAEGEGTAGDTDGEPAAVLADGACGADLVPAATDGSPIGGVPIENDGST